MKMRGKILIFGSSGHARTIAEAAHLAGFVVAGFVDGSKSVGERIDSWRVLGADEDIAMLLKTLGPDCSVIVGIGDNMIRQRVTESLTEKVPYIRFTSVFHPSAILTSCAKIEKGSFVAAGAILNPGVTVGPHVVINTGARVDHDCCLAAFSFIGPGAILSGNVTVRENSFIGAGATLIPNVTVGNHALVAAGAVVIGDVFSQSRIAGVPAKSISLNE